MKRWEYLVLNLGRNSSADDDENDLNERGADGWELVSTIHSGATFAYLKRPVATQPSSEQRNEKETR